MEAGSFFYILILIVSVILSLIILVKYFRLCKDVHIIRENIDKKWEILSVVENYPKGTVAPTEDDINQFRKRVKEHIWANGGIDRDDLEKMIAKYNAQFNVDFHQFLKRQ